MQNWVHSKARTSTKIKNKNLEEAITNFMMNGNYNLPEQSKMRKLFGFMPIVNLYLQIHRKTALWNGPGPFKIFVLPAGTVLSFVTRGHRRDSAGINDCFLRLAPAELLQNARLMQCPVAKPPATNSSPLQWDTSLYTAWVLISGKLQTADF